MIASSPSLADPPRRRSVRLRAAVIGLGVGWAHAETLAALEECDLAAVCDLSARQRAQAQQRFAGARIVADAAEVLRDPDIDLVAIASYDDAHAEQVLTALRHGKHVFAEKPLCMAPNEAAAIRAELRARPHQCLSSNLILRRSPRFLALRQRIAAGALGELMHVEGDYLYGRLSKLTEGWRGQMPRYSVVLGGAIHMIDLLRWLSGREVVEVAAMGNAVATRGTRFRHLDQVSALLGFDDGMTGVATVSYGCVRPHFHRLAIYGTRATFENDLPAARLYESREPEKVPRGMCEAYPGVGKGALLAEFVRAIQSGTAPEPSAEDVFRTLAVCFAIEQAAARRSVESVDYAFEAGHPATLTKGGL